MGFFYFIHSTIFNISISVSYFLLWHYFALCSFQVPYILTSFIYSFIWCTLSSSPFFKLSARNSIWLSTTKSYVIYFAHTHALRDLLFVFVSRMFLYIILKCSHCLFHSLYHQIFLYSVAEHIVIYFNQSSSTCSHSLLYLSPHTYHRLFWHTIFNVFLLFTLMDKCFNIYYLHHSNLVRFHIIMMMFINIVQSHNLLFLSICIFCNFI